MLETLWPDLALASGASFRLGRLHGVDGDGRLLVRVGETDKPCGAAIGVDLEDDALREAARASTPVLLVLLEGQAPIVIAVLRERLGPQGRRGRGRRRITAPEALELRCGKASVRLTRAGRVEIRGTHLVSASSGPNKIKGASVALN